MITSANFYKRAIMKKSFLAVLAAASLAFGAPGATQSASNQNKILVENFWNSVFNKHDTSVIDSDVGSEYKQHSPNFKDGKAAFKSAVGGFLKEFPQSSAVIKRIGADGELVFIHNHIKLNPSDRGQAAVDIFRVKDGKIVEHWDVIQDLPEKAENNNTMF